MNLNPASMISTGRETTALDSITGFVAGLANAAQAHPFMTLLGIAGAAAILYAARHLTHVSNDTARKTAAAYAASQRATEAVRSPGKLTAKAISDAAEVPRGRDYTKRDTIVNRVAFADTMPPVPAVGNVIPIRTPQKMAQLWNEILDDRMTGVRQQFADTQVQETMPAAFRG